MEWLNISRNISCLGRKPHVLNFIRRRFVIPTDYYQIAYVLFEKCGNKSIDFSMRRGDLTFCFHSRIHRRQIINEIVVFQNPLLLSTLENSARRKLLGMIVCSQLRSAICSDTVIVGWDDTISLSHLVHNLMALDAKNSRKIFLTMARGQAPLDV